MGTKVNGLCAVEFKKESLILRPRCRRRSSYSWWCSSTLCLALILRMFIERNVCVKITHACLSSQLVRVLTGVVALSSGVDCMGIITIRQSQVVVGRFVQYGKFVYRSNSLYYKQYRLRHACKQYRLRHACNTGNLYIDRIRYITGKRKTS